MEVSVSSYPLCLGNISKDLAANNMKKAELNGYVFDFSVDYVINNTNIIDTHKYLKKKRDIKCLLLLRQYLSN